MKKLIILWLLLGYVFDSFSQIVTITDKQTQKPLPGVVLISKNLQISAVTNNNGQADITALKKTASIQIRLLGYKTQTISYSNIQALKFNIALEQSFFDLDQVVVSTTRWHQITGNVPAKIVSISAKEVVLQNPQTAADLLGISGKVFIQKSQQGGGSPMIRGFATNRLIYTVDGVRMNTAIFRGGNLQNVINIDPFATENTEILFGPGSVIYGSDAIGGVMSFQTLNPQLSLSDSQLVTGKVVARYATANNEKTAHVDVNVGWNKWAMVTSFSSWDYDNLRQGSHGPQDYIKNVYPQRQDSMDVVITQNDPLLQIPSAYSQINLMQKVRYKPNEKWNFQYGFHYSETSPYGRYDRHNRYKNGTIRYAEWRYGPQKWMMNNLNIANYASSLPYDQMTIRLAQQCFEESRIHRSLNSDERTTNIENVEAYSVNLDFTKNTGARNNLYYGAEYVLNDVVSKGVITDIITDINQTGPARYPNANWSSIAAYVHDEFKMFDRLTFQAGLRYNQFVIDADFSNNLDYYPFPFATTRINNGALTGSIGGVYRPTEQWAIKTILGKAFRSPNVDDIGKVFDSEPGAVVIPNPNLEAEYAYNFDLGITKIFGDVAKLDITGYYTVLQNALVRRDYKLDGKDSIMYDGLMSKVQAIQNAAVAKVYGVQAGIEIKLPAGWSVLSDLNYQHGEEELDDGTTSPSRHAAPLFGVSRLRYRHENLTFELNAIYQGERSFEDLAVSEQDKDEIYAKDVNGNNYAPAWYTLSLKANCQLNDLFTITGGVENITDQRYRPYSSGISGAGRNFILSMKCNF